MILAGIDIGTNTLRLLIAEPRGNAFHEIHSDRRITRLGERLDEAGYLSEAAQERSIETLAEFSKKIRQHRADAVSAVGTSALRNARNSPQFIAGVSRRTGLEIRVISGSEEANLTLTGVAGALKGYGHGAANPLGSALVIDIGGGSTEMISTGPDRGPREESLPLGAVYLTERFLKHDPALPGELDLVRRSINKELDACPVASAADKMMKLVGTAGTITTLAAIDQKLVEYDPEKINRSTLTRNSIDVIVRKLSQSTLKERRTIRGLEHGREDIILAGALIVQEIMERFGFTEMLVSDWGLREGIILDLYRKVSGDAAKQY